MNKQSALWLAVVLALAAMGPGCVDTGRRSLRSQVLTVLLGEYAGPEALASAERLAGELRRQGLEDVFVVGDKGRAAVCCGRFKDLSDDAAKDMLKRVKQIRDRQGNRPFAFVALVPVPEKPVPNPWPLVKAPGIYSVHVASYEAPGRQKAAGKYAKKLRSRGWSAYIYNGPTVSMVTIGAFNRDIFDDPKLVLKINPEIEPKIISPEVNRIFKAFPVLMVDGKARDTSKLVRIPHRSLPGQRRPTWAAPHSPQAEVMFQCSLRLVDLKKGFAPPGLMARGKVRSRSELFSLVLTMVRKLTTSATVSAKPASVVRIAVVDVVAANPQASRSGIAKSVTNMVITACGALNDKTKKEKGAKLFHLVPSEEVAEALKKARIAPETASLKPGALARFLKADYILTGSVAQVSLLSLDFGGGEGALPKSKAKK